MNRILGSRRKAVTGDWGQLHEVYNLYSLSKLGDQMNKRSWTCGTHDGEDNCTQGFAWSS